MEATVAKLEELIQNVSNLAEVPEVQALIEMVRQQQQQIEVQQQQIEQLKDEPSQAETPEFAEQFGAAKPDLLKKPSRKETRKSGKKRGPKYDHPGSTRNGFGQANQIVRLGLETCPVCGKGVTVVEEAPLKVQQVAELVEKPVEIWEYQRPKYHCDECGWSGYGPLPWGVKEGFSYGAKLSSVIGWLGYGGNLTWHKQIAVMELIFKVPMSQGSLAKMHRWFQESLEPSYQQWLKWVQEPGVRCVDETTYLIDGIKHWLWVATSDQFCVLLLAPTRSAVELQQLLGQNFEGILSSDCFSAYNPQSATAKQKCLTHLERDLRSLEISRFAANRDFSSQVSNILKLARQAHRDYHSGQLSLEQLHASRLQFESQLQTFLDNPQPKGWPADAQRLRQRLYKYWSDWFTFLSHPEVKPDNNDALTCFASSRCAS